MECGFSEGRLTMPIDAFIDALSNLGMTQKAFGEAMGLHKNTVYQWTSGLVPIPRWALAHLQALRSLHQIASLGTYTPYEELTVLDVLESHRLPSQRLPRAHNATLYADVSPKVRPESDTNPIFTSKKLNEFKLVQCGNNFPVVDFPELARSFEHPIRFYKDASDDYE